MYIHIYTNNYNNLKISNYDNYDNRKRPNYKHVIKK